LEKLVLDTIRRGYRLVKTVATQSTVAAAVMTKAQPLRLMMTNTTASTMAAIPRSAGRIGGKTLLSFRSTATATVQERKAARTSAARMESRRAVTAARRQRSPVVRRVRKVDPWKANRSTTVSPPSRV
jgi:hypothetical protein